MHRFLTFFTVLACLPTPAMASWSDLELAAGSGRLTGETTYQIGGHALFQDGSAATLRFPISELKFPLDVYTAWISSGITLGDKFRLQGKVQHAVSQEAGTMVDQDWGINYHQLDAWQNDNSLDIYSTSDASLTAILSEVTARLKLYDSVGRIAYWAGLGYIHQRLDFDISNVDQWYPSLNAQTGTDIGHDRVSGLVATYHTTYNIPYVDVAISALVSPQCGLEIRGGFSPFATAHDEDEHILRNRNFLGDADGYALLFSMKLQYNFRPAWFLDFQFDFLDVYTEGTQDQYENRVFDTTIDTVIESRQMSFGAGLGCRF